MANREELEEHFDRLSPAVNRNAVIVTPEDLGQDYLLHISTNTNIKEFVPLIGFRQAKSEDRTVPRICTAPTILGCMIAYCAIEQDFLTKDKKDRESKKWKGGYKIYGFKFDAAVKPNQKLVYDQKTTDEHWLINFSSETTTWVPEDYGRMFLRTITFTANGVDTAEGDMSLFIEVKKEDGLLFSKGVVLEKGYYKITGPSPTFVKWTSSKEYEITNIDKGEYLSNKKAVADTLGLTEDIAQFMRW